MPDNADYIMKLAALKEIEKLEIELHNPAIRSDKLKLEALLHDEFAECGRSGWVYTREDMLKELAQEELDYSVWSQDFTLTELSEDSVLLTYRSAHMSVDGALSKHAFRSSLWLSTSQGWKIRFHQGTPIDAFERRSN